MDENNNRSEHATEAISSDITHGDGADAPKNRNINLRDGNEEGTRIAPFGQGPENRRQMPEEQRSHFPRRNVQGQGFQRNNSAGGNKRGGGYRSFRKEKYDKIAAEKIVIDYKQPEILKRFLTEYGKILSRYVTGNSAKNQRRLVREVKRARFIGLLPSA